MFLSESIQNKWQPVLDHPDLPKINDSYALARSGDGTDVTN